MFREQFEDKTYMKNLLVSLVDSRLLGFDDILTELFLHEICKDITDAKSYKVGKLSCSRAGHGHKNTYRYSLNFNYAEGATINFIISSDYPHAYTYGVTSTTAPELVAINLQITYTRKLRYYDDFHARYSSGRLALAGNFQSVAEAVNKGFEQVMQGNNRKFMESYIARYRSNCNETMQDIQKAIR